MMIKIQRSQSCSRKLPKSKMSNDLKIECLTETELTFWEKVTEDENFAENLSKCKIVNDAFIIRKFSKIIVLEKSVIIYLKAVSITKTIWLWSN